MPEFNVGDEVIFRYKTNGGTYLAVVAEYRDYGAEYPYLLNILENIEPPTNMNLSISDDYWAPRRERPYGFPAYGRELEIVAQTRLYDTIMAATS